MAAAVQLVSERGSTSLAVADLSEAANVSRQLVYVQFGDRDALLVAAATDLVEREFLPEVGEADTPRQARLTAMARHFAARRPFYRAMLTGSCAFPMTRALNKLFSSLVTTEGLRAVFGELDEETARDIASVITVGTGAIVNEWLIEAADPLDPEELVHRLLRLSSVLTRPIVPE